MKEKAGLSEVSRTNVTDEAMEEYPLPTVRREAIRSCSRHPAVADPKGKGLIVIVTSEEADVLQKLVRTHEGSPNDNEYRRYAHNNGKCKSLVGIHC
jgi:hypothetical protein